MDSATNEQRAHQALYRKYRPSVFDHVRGQEPVVSVLRAAVEQGKIAHAYLFAGGRGTGKTSMARILAHAVGTSDNDIYEMDAASNRGIDEIRELRDSVATLPFASTYKFYIIDEAHALTPQAWQALLKTLEEPPSHVVFVLATTELEKVPDTILSRCQTFRFAKPAQEVLVQLVLDVAKKEGVAISRPGAEIIALMGDGSFRDTLGILQKVLTLSADNTLAEEEIARVVGAPTSGMVNELLLALAAKDLAHALALLNSAVAQGVEAKVFVLLLVAKVRTILLLRFSPQLKNQIAAQYNAADSAILADLAGSKGAAVNSRLLAELITALLEITRAPLPIVPLELALYRVFGVDSVTK